jgi:hypothetical protein
MTNYFFKVVANGIELDTFTDEQVLVSNNSTGLFDIDKLPADFTRQLTIPGSKKNNSFFQHAYDIDIDTPFLFQESEKVACYIDISGYLVVQGYLQLNKINVINNKVESYDISLYGSLSNFSRDLQKNNLTDITGLDVYNHTASYQNITGSWDGNLFGGDIVYPLADYGFEFKYQSSALPGQFGIDTDQGSLNVQDFKPAIRVKKVVDKIFEEFGYTYTSSFFAQPMWDDIYMLCDRGKQYPIFDGVDLDGYGQVKIAPTSGSTTDIVLNTSTYTLLNFDTTDFDPSFAMGPNATYNLPINSLFQGDVKLNIYISGSSTGDIGYPQIQLGGYSVGLDSTFELGVEEINKYLRETYSQLDKIGEKTYTLEETWLFVPVGIPPAGDWQFKAKYSVVGTGDFDITIAKDGNTESYITVDRVNFAADYRVMEIAQNMPFGENGITCLDFIRGLQRKYNLVITPSKINVNQFEIETFNDWYKSGNTKDLTQFIKMDKQLKVVPANTLAVNELEFTDSLGKDYLGRNFNDLNNRIYGASTFIDSTNQFSQGKIDVETTFSSSPLRYIEGTGGTGGSTPPTAYAHAIVYNNSLGPICDYGSFPGTAFKSTSGPIAFGDQLFKDSALTIPWRWYFYIQDVSNGKIYLMNRDTGVVGSNVYTC